MALNYRYSTHFCFLIFNPIYQNSNLKIITLYCHMLYMMILSDRQYVEQSAYTYHKGIWGNANLALCTLHCSTRWRQW